MLLLEMLLARLLWGLKVLRFLLGDSIGRWSSGIVTVDQRDDEDLDDSDDVEDVARYKYIKTENEFDYLFIKKQQTSSFVVTLLHTMSQKVSISGTLNMLLGHQKLCLPIKSSFLSLRVLRLLRSELQACFIELKLL